MSVRLRSTGENPLLRAQPTTVDGDGAFEATFDLSDVAGGTDLHVVVHRNGTRLVEAEGTVVG